jgi:hypothetical protein
LARAVEGAARELDGLPETQERLRQEQEAVRRLRLNLEGRAARQAARDAAWRQQCERTEADLRAREWKAERLHQSLAELCRRWAERRRQDVDRLRTELAQGEQARQDWAEQAAAARGELRALRRQKQALTEQELALEYTRLEWLGKAERSKDAARRLEQLEQRWASLSAAGEQELDQRRRHLEAEAAKLAERSRQVNARLNEVVTREAELAGRDFERERVRAEERFAARADTPVTDLWPAQRERYERQVGELREEVERLALLLIDDDAPPVQPAQAA